MADAEVTEVVSAMKIGLVITVRCVQIPFLVIYHAIKSAVPSVSVQEWADAQEQARVNAMIILLEQTAQFVQAVCMDLKIVISPVNPTSHALVTGAVLE